MNIAHERIRAAAKTALILSFIGLSGCQTVPFPSKPSNILPVGGSAQETEAFARAGSNSIEIEGQALALAQPSSVDLTGVNACELVKVVFAENLKLRTSCTATGGNLSLYSDFRGGAQLFRLAKAALENAGALVVVADGVVSVSQAASEPVAGFSGGSPLVAPDLNAAQPPEGFVIQASPDAAKEVKRSIETMPGRKVRALPGTPERAKFVAQALDLDVRIVSGHTGSVGIGTDEDVELLAQAIEARDVATASLPVARVPDAFLAVLSSQFAVEAFYDATEGALVISGPAVEVAKASRMARSVVFPAKDRSVRAAFVYSSDDSLARLESSGALVRSGSGVSVFVGAASGAEGTDKLALYLDQLRSMGKVRVSDNPALQVRDGVEARFLNGREVPVQLESTEEGGATVEYRPVGTSLVVRTYPRRGNLVRVAVDLEVSTVDGTGVLDNPSFAKRSVHTEVIVAPGSLVVISGFQADRAERSEGRQLFVFPSRSSSSKKEGMHIALTVD